MAEVLRLSSGFIIGPFREPSPEKILLQSKGAFGSGSHPTTRLCLEILDSLYPDCSPALDLGAGTGILALLLAKKGWRRVLAVEPDPKAIRVLAENILRNRMEERILPVKGDLSCLRGPFSLVVANLYLRILVPEAPNLKKLLLPGGRLVLSGFLASSLPAIKRAYTPLEVERELVFEGWAAVSFLTP